MSDTSPVVNGDSKTDSNNVHSDNQHDSQPVPDLVSDATAAGSSTHSHSDNSDSDCHSGGDNDSDTSHGSQSAKRRELNIETPIRLLDILCLQQDSKQLGNTPRPSKVQSNFLAGMQAVERGQLPQAEKRLTAALKEAVAHVKQTEASEPALSSPLAKQDLERAGYSAAGFAYLMYLRDELAQSEAFYKQSITV
jgi:hypothetical protein